MKGTYVYRNLFFFSFYNEYPGDTKYGVFVLWYWTVVNTVLLQRKCIITLELASCCIVRLKRDGTRAETTFRLSPKRTSPFKSVGASVQSTAGSRGVRISLSNAGYTTFRGSMRVLATHSIRHFPLHFPSRASPCAITFQTHPTSGLKQQAAHNI